MYNSEHVSENLREPVSESKPQEHVKTAHSTLTSLHRLLDNLDCVGDNEGALREDMIARARHLVARLAKLLDFPKPFDQCTAADIAESLSEIGDSVNALAQNGLGPDGESRETRETREAICRMLERAISWVEEAGSQLSGNVPWKPGAR